MANYYASSRSNYFKVKHKKKFEAWCSKRRLNIWKTDNTYAIYPEDTDGMWPTYSNDVEFDLLSELSTHLYKNNVAVLFEIGSEKLRYLIGQANAVDSQGNITTVDLDTIYQQAELEFGVNNISRAEY